MSLFIADTSYNGIAHQIRKCDTKYKAQKGANSGGFISPQIEREFNLAISYWRKKIINGNNSNMYGLDQLTWKTEGNIKNGPAEFVNLMIKDAALFKLITNKFKGNKNIAEFSFLRIYLLAYELLTDTKNISVFQKAYKICKQTKGKPSGSNIADIFVMTHTVLSHFLASCIGTINTVFYQTITSSTVSWENYNEAGLEELILKLQKDFRATVGIPGFATIELYYFFNSMGNPLQEFNKSLKVEADTLKEMTTAKEAFDYYSASNDRYLVNRTGDRGQEEFVTVALILVGIIAGIIAVGKIIQWSIYKIASLKIDIVKYIIIENEILRMGIEELDQKILNEKNPAAKKKLEQIKKRQEGWRNRFDKFIIDWGKDIYEAEASAQSQIETEEEQAAYSQTQTTKDYEVVL